LAANDAISMVYLGSQLAGKIKFGERAQEIIKRIGSSILYFTEEDFWLHPSCVVCLGDGHVTGLAISNQIHRGSVILREGPGVKIRVDSADGVCRVKFDANEEVSSDCCNDDYSPVKTLNDVSPNELGGIFISELPTDEPENKESPRQAIKVTNIPGGIKISIT
jgi:hypothetical protein